MGWGWLGGGGGGLHSKRHQVVGFRFLRFPSRQDPILHWLSNLAGSLPVSTGPCLRRTLICEAPRGGLRTRWMRHRHEKGVSQVVGFTLSGVLSVKTPSTLPASLSGTFLQTLPDSVTPLKGHSLSPRSCPATRSAPPERFRY